MNLTIAGCFGYIEGDSLMWCCHGGLTSQLLWADRCMHSLDEGNGYSVRARCMIDHTCLIPCIQL